MRGAGSVSSPLQFSIRPGALVAPAPPGAGNQIKSGGGRASLAEPSPYRPEVVPVFPANHVT